jgi:hypothetical protein
LLRYPKQAAAALDTIFLAQLPQALNDVGRRSAIAKLIADWIVANPAAALAAGLAVK